ncbi:MAG: RHS repeat domain-containing protein, partial [Woeseiaceae bacterium]
MGLSNKVAGIEPEPQGSAQGTWGGTEVNKSMARCTNPTFRFCERVMHSAVSVRLGIFATAFLSFAVSATVFAQSTSEPRIGPWGHNVSKCTNFSNAATAAEDCRKLDGGTWAGTIPWRCDDPAHPRPWRLEALIEPKVSDREGGQPTHFTGWLNPGEQTGCTGAWSGGVGTTMGIESTNLGLVEVGDAAVTDYMARRDRTVACPQGYSWDDTTCILPAGELTLHKNNDFCPASPNGSNPVHSNTGKKLQQERDYVGTGPFPLRFTRYYSSGQRGYFGDTHIRFGSLGTNWRHTYSREIILVDADGARTATAVRPNGNEYFFNEDAQGNWTGDPDVSDRLEALVDAGGIVGWRYHTAADEVEEYDVSGRLILITSREGFTQTLSYDLTLAEGGDDLPDTLDTVTGSFGERSLRFSYGGDGKISQMTLMPGGEVYRFEYDTRLLTKVFYPDDNDNPADPLSYEDNPFRQYAYNESAYVTGNPAPASLTGIFDESGTRHASWWYSDDRVVRSQLAPDDLVDVNRVDFLYHSDGTRTITDAIGTARLYDFEIRHGVAKIGSITGGPCETCGSSVQSVTYDANGYKDTVTDFNGNVTDYDYNVRGLEVQRIEAAGTPSQRTIQTDWHADFRVPVERRTLDVGGALVTTTTMTYNARGQLLTSTQTDPVTAATRSTTTAYCEQADVEAPGSTCPLLGLLKSVDGPRADVSDVTTYAYYPDTDETGCDSGGACRHRGDLWKVTNALGHTTEFTRYDRAGRVVQMTDANGVVTDLEYHARGWLTASKVRG